MNGFLWAGGHLGWGIFAVAVFTGLSVLTADFYWRLRDTRIVRFLMTVLVSWLIGTGLILLAFFFASR